MSNSKTVQRIFSKDQDYLETLQKEVQDYQGLRTELTSGELLIHLIDSDKYWRKQNRRKKVEEDEDSYE